LLRFKTENVSVYGSQLCNLIVTYERGSEIETEKDREGERQRERRERGLFTYYATKLGLNLRR
jgi:hypothetical protein